MEIIGMFGMLLLYILGGVAALCLIAVYLNFISQISLESYWRIIFLVFLLIPIIGLGAFFIEMSSVLQAQYTIIDFLNGELDHILGNYTTILQIFLVVFLVMWFTAFLLPWYRYKWFRIVFTVIGVITVVCIPFLILMWIGYYLFGEPPERVKKFQDFDKKYKQIRKLARKGDANALCELAACYGEDPFFNLKKEFSFYKKAAKKGSAKAQYWLSCSAKLRHAKRVDWCIKSAEQGYTKAMFDIAERYSRGWGIDGVEKDLSKAFDWYLKTAKKGNAIAQYKVGHAYAYGEGVEINDEEACDWLIKSANKNNKDAMILLLAIKEYDLTGKVDKEKTIKWETVAKAWREEFKDDIKKSLDSSNNTGGSWYLRQQKEHEDYLNRLHAWATGADGSDIEHYDVSDM